MKVRTSDLYADLRRRGQLTLGPGLDAHAPALRRLAKQDDLIFGQARERAPKGERRPSSRRSLTVWIEDGNGNLVFPDERPPHG